MKINKLLLGILVVMVLLLVAFLMSRRAIAPMPSATALPRGEVELAMIPSSSSVSVGQTFTVDIVMDTHTATVAAAELHLSFPANMLQSQNIEKRDFLPVVLTPGTTGPGTANIILGSEPANPRKGNGIVARVTLKALAAGTTTIGFSTTTQVAAIGHDGNVAGILTPLTITVQ